MTKTVVLLIALAGLAMANQAQGQIGWTLEQCEAAYAGKPAKTNVVEHHGSTIRDYTFNLNAKSKAAAPGEEVVLSVFVSFWDADPHCNYVTFSKPSFEAFTDREIRVLLNANSLGHQWNFWPTIVNQEEGPLWHTFHKKGEESLSAEQGLGPHTLTIFGPIEDF